MVKNSRSILLWRYACYCKDYVFLINILFHLARNNIQHAGVQYIIDSVVRALDANPDRRFIYVEIGFFWRWWNEQSDVIRNKVKGFVNSGKLFVMISYLR
jgi:hypothetical protein